MKRSNLDRFPNTDGQMTSGSIAGKLLMFCIPLLLSNLFQLLYNTVDSVIVGNFVGSDALAAVGAATPIINLFVAFFVGLSTGAGVIVARNYGAGKEEELKKAVHTFLDFSLKLGVILSVVGVLLTSFLLTLIGVPDEIFVQAHDYLGIYFCGNVFVIVYNACTGILQAVGDARHPLYFLGTASCINIVLDLVFVTVFGSGVQGAAIATVISQAVSAFLVVRLLLRTEQPYRIRLRDLHTDFAVLKQIIAIGIPAGLQQMIVSLSNVVVQSYVNTFGSAAIAGYSSANKFDNFLLLPVTSFGLAVTTFTGQNIGAQKYDRARRGIVTALIMSVSIVSVMGALVYLNADACMMLFSQEKDVIEAGAELIRIMCPFYGILCFHQVFTGALRAEGLSHVPMFTAVLAFVVYRQVFLSLALERVHEISIVGWSFSSSWALGAILTSGYYFAHCMFRRKESKLDNPN